ncbi:hypothetical protein I568_00374 [Enterococcus columbae DSM 7374 = ATCC 51263]|uniref:NlpC/P60 domain-containing protein n=2 Tax=Enterococcus columbae TaxID=1355 RepID=S0KD93_9ENTE|nr:NlpC/P60 family protein [Enterococcus columbae]EOT42854.1 hypothetical protein OMW_00832 [Enterococcus columbae DSM 7374 = ATCC 51263]EOW87709.1 hypothetical protein I568_00374 [Enterococcus columbae DSM 7374 = ATCC 51263]
MMKKFILMFFCFVLFIIGINFRPIPVSALTLGDNEEIDINMSAKQKAIVFEALKYQNVPYVWGGKTPAGFDCSGLIQYVYQQAIGMNIPSPTSTQEKYGVEVSLDQLQPGDILFWGIKGQSYHDAIYLGNGDFIHATEPGDVVKVTNVQWFKPDYARRVLSANDLISTQPANVHTIYRLYNPNNGQHLFTNSLNEYRSLVKIGWNGEKEAFNVSESGTPVYRLYNPYSGEHHFTVSSDERERLSEIGWRFEGVSWQSFGNIPVYRLFNPFANGKSDAHHFTTSLAEKNNLLSLGWRDEGIAWYVVS